jgi:hypothetical protein
VATHIRALVNVLDVGACHRGHVITAMSDTTVVNRYRGLFCAACRAELRFDDFMKAVDKEVELAAERNESVIDDYAVELRKRGDPVSLTRTELRIAVRDLVRVGYSASQVSLILHISGRKVAEMVAGD